MSSESRNDAVPAREPRETQPLLQHEDQGSYPPSPRRDPVARPGSVRESVRSYRDQYPLPDPLAATSVRYYRYLLYILAGCGFLSFLALNVDAYSYLGLSSPQGSGLDTLAVVLVAFVSILLSLMFYSIPSYLDQVLCFATCLVLLVDLVIVLAVPELRHRQGKIGVLAYLSALVSFFIGAYANLVVKASKESEDMRIFGHYDNRKTLGEWLRYFLLNAARVALFFGVIILSINVAIDAADSNLQPLGTIYPVDVDSNGINIHVACTPAGKGPLVLVESGDQSAEESARWVISAGHIGTVCYWDRPGHGFSDNAPSPLALGQTVDILMGALDMAHPGYRNESTILVSSGVGSLYSRVLAARLGKSVEGIMLVDGLHEELFYDTWGLFKSFYHFTKGTISSFRFAKIASVWSSFGAEDRVFGRLESISPRYQKALMQEYASASRQSRRDIGDATLALPPHVPLLVVSSSERCKDQQWSTYQRLLLKLSDNVLAWKIIEGPKDLWRGSKSSKELTDLLETLVKYV